MKELYKPLRGMRDILPKDAYGLDRVKRVGCEVSSRYGYRMMETPLLEDVRVFGRSLGESTDVVGKEMYNFEDKSGLEVALRPEMTAGIARAALTHGWHQRLPVRVFYGGAMFRYERPQKGRYRQFHQIGIEALGVGGSQGDSEAITVGYEVLKALGVERRVGLELNSLGSKESRRVYRERLYDWLSPRREGLSEDSRRRLESNPLRILDSKDEGDKELLVDAPGVEESWCDESKRHYDEVREHLTLLGIPYSENGKLVRGLDYYCHTIFEFVVEDWGNQGAVLAGGCYDGLTSLLGGVSLAGVGWAGGCERLLTLCEEEMGEEEEREDWGVLSLGEDAERVVRLWSEKWRGEGWRGVNIGRVTLKKGLKTASRLGLRYVVIVGSDEWERGEVLVRDMDEGTQVRRGYEDWRLWLGGEG